MHDNEKKEINRICKWIGNGEGCRHPAIFGKFYCEVHHERVYLVLYKEMADYIIEKELNNER